jgi:AraC family transcriptional regulator of adaptative response/methylated-DNA-[protein]-cysteine methyltransferase
MKTPTLTDPPAPPQSYATPELRWQAVVDRDATADGVFWYSVKSTGVYCVPSCPSRLAKRENVAFHDSIAAAGAAGFRACQRCRPDGGRSLAEEHAAAVARACRLIESADEAPALSALAAVVGMSQYHFHRVFKQVTGLTPKAFAVADRAAKMRVALPKRSTVTEAIYEAGFNSNSRFYSGSTAMLGMKPRSYRGGGKGETIRFAIGECSLGSILIASSAKGICAILLGDDPNELAMNLQDRFPQAELVAGDAEFERMVATVVGFVETPGMGLELPLDVRGTVFQQRVWQALREIPSGSTASYADIAAAIGQPSAVRAVAGACAANAIAVAIPCHRVLRLDGSLSGYRWGVARKQSLLDREKV